MKFAVQSAWAQIHSLLTRQIVGLLIDFSKCKNKMDNILTLFGTPQLHGKIVQ